MSQFTIFFCLRLEDWFAAIFLGIWCALFSTSSYKSRPRSIIVICIQYSQSFFISFSSYAQCCCNEKKRAIYFVKSENALKVVLNCFIRKLITLSIHSFLYFSILFHHFYPKSFVSNKAYTRFVSNTYRKRMFFDIFIRFVGCSISCSEKALFWN